MDQSPQSPTRRKPYEKPGFDLETAIEAAAAVCTPGPGIPDELRKTTAGAPTAFGTCDPDFLTS
ncbi:MAG: hypothetical protein HY722_06370 [Planctomycetes bacterium]|nr:hypothetical protein [Planctomycetota bacterium]